MTTIKELLPPATTPSQEQIDTYNARGWCVSDQLIDTDVLDRAAAAILSHQTGKRDYSLAEGARYSDWVVGDGAGVRNNEFCSLQTNKIRELAWNSVIGEFAALLAGTSQIRLFDDQAISKPSSSSINVGVVGWHTDHSYWSTCTSTKMLTAWIPLADTTKETGTLTVVDESHLWPESEHIRDFNNGDLHNLEKLIGRPIPVDSVINIELKKGQVSFHHMRTLHSSTANTSGKDRVALAVHLQDRDNKYRTFRTDNGEIVKLPHDHLCRTDDKGLPD